MSAFDSTKIALPKIWRPPYKDNGRLTADINLIRYFIQGTAG